MRDEEGALPYCSRPGREIDRAAVWRLKLCTGSQLDGLAGAIGHRGMHIMIDTRTDQPICQCWSFGHERAIILSPIAAYDLQNAALMQQRPSFARDWKSLCAPRFH